MLELRILEILIGCEANMSLVRGRVVGFNITWIRKDYGIPSGTFYRAINTLIGQKMIVRTQRGHYALGDRFRKLLNRVPDGDFVKVQNVNSI